MGRNGPADSDVPLSIEEYIQLPDDGFRTELVRGRVVREPQPGFPHGRVQIELGHRIKSFIERHHLELECVGPVGAIIEEHPDTVRGPDLAVLRRERAKSLGRASFVQGAPDLAIEILSPSNRPSGVREKVREYLRTGAMAVWVVDPDQCTVAIHGSGGAPALLTREDVLEGGDLLPGFRIDLADLFAS